MNKKENTKKIILITSLIVLIVIAVISTSYAFITITKTGEKSTLLTAGTLSIDLNEGENAINLINAAPMSDNQGKEQTPFTFTLTNNGTLNSEYTIYLIDNAITDETNRLSDSEVRYQLIKTKSGNIEKNIDSLSNLTKNETGIILDSGLIGINQTNSYELNLWIKYEATIESAGGKELSKKLYVVATQVVQDGLYVDALLNGADPVLTDNLIPIQIADDGTVTKANIYENWYDYGNKNWANAVVLKNPTITYRNGDTIPESNIESYFVWIPKYSYKIWDLGNYNGNGTIDNSKNKPIEITFGLTNTSDSVQGQCTTPMLSGESGNCDVGEYMTHPAFISMNSNGLWVGKFETGYDGATSTETAQINNANSSAIIIKPNVYSWRSIQPANASTASLNYMTSENSHMMKNTEWGAVAYLTNSIYGTCNDTTCSEVRINNNSAYITGYAAIASDTTSYSSTSLGVDGTDTLNYLNPLSQVASTTGNYTGIYDMSGGAWEYVMGVLAESTTSTIPMSGRHNLYNSGFNGVFGCPTCDSTISGVDSSILSLTTGINFPDSKYYDIYKYSTSSTAYLNRILGDATGELGPFNGGRSSYNNDYANFVYSSAPWFVRGGIFNSGTSAGVLSFHNNYGSADSYRSFRLVLSPNES